jgi:starch phosphorylase
VAQRWSRGWDPRAAIEGSPELLQVLEALEYGVFSPGEPDRHRPLAQSVRHGDRYMIAADFASYYETQRTIDELWRSPSEWAKIAMTNTAKMAWFSSDRSIAEYATDIWRVPFDGIEVV